MRSLSFFGGRPVRREGGKVPVDCAMVRNVRKPSGALPGKVIYTEYKTLLTQADETLVTRLKR